MLVIIYCILISVLFYFGAKNNELSTGKWWAIGFFGALVTYFVVVIIVSFMEMKILKQEIVNGVGFIAFPGSFIAMILIYSKWIVGRGNNKSSGEYNKGIALMNDQKYEDAINHFKEFVKTNPHSHVTYYNLACAYSVLGNNADSFHYLKLAIQNGYKNFEKILSDPDLASLVKSQDFQTFRQNGYK